jgi:hypothetical protein
MSVLADRIGAVGVELWDTEWAAEKAAEALRYLGRNYPECLENLRVLDEHDSNRLEFCAATVLTLSGTS